MIKHIRNSLYMTRKVKDALDKSHLKEVVKKKK
jgi:hypothetical protein